MFKMLAPMLIQVISTIDCYGNILWADVATNAESMSEQLTIYQAQCNKMPKALSDWDAYKMLNDTINNFCELLPLVEQLAQKSNVSQHWNQIMELCGTEIDLDPKVMKLQHVLGMGLLEHSEARTHARVYTRMHSAHRHTRPPAHPRACPPACKPVRTCTHTCRRSRKS